MASKLGEMLVKAQLITDSSAGGGDPKIQRREGGKLGSIVVRQGYCCSDQDIVSFLGMQYGVPAADLEQWPHHRGLGDRPGSGGTWPIKHKVLPLQRSGNVLTLAMSDPTDIFAMDDVRFHTGYNIDPVVSSEMGLDQRPSSSYYGRFQRPAPPGRWAPGSEGGGESGLRGPQRTEALGAFNKDRISTMGPMDAAWISRAMEDELSDVDSETQYDDP